MSRRTVCWWESRGALCYLEAPDPSAVVLPPAELAHKQKSANGEAWSALVLRKKRAFFPDFKNLNL